jgi:hypothetical protein
MTDTEGARGEAAWKEQRAEIARRNAETRKRGQAERRERDGASIARERAESAREGQELDALNAKMEKRRSAGAR